MKESGVKQYRNASRGGRRHAPTEKAPDSVYQTVYHMQETDHMHVVGQYLFCPVQFKNFFFETYRDNPGAKKAMRCLVQCGTVSACLGGCYYLPDGRKVALDKALQHKAAILTKCYPSDYHFNLPDASSGQTELTLIAGDCIDAALWLKSQGLKPAILNMASAWHPGGGWKKGAGAQEENLHRRTALFHCLGDPFKVTAESRAWNYPIPEFGALYSPGVLTFRHSEANGYAFFERPELFSYISASAYNQPPLVEDPSAHTLALSGKVRANTARKIDTIFRVAIENGHDSLVLSAFGCGAYGNPPADIARLLGAAAARHGGHLRSVVFAVLDDHNAGRAHNPDGNLRPFAEALGLQPRTADPLL
eukprot:TRINITY_DN3730_c0_g1_i1.p1 TRINITY_DN3730_c0_g1~~TRINITY_DN3730_c0_g1_i1.p1  ORF type:complete len:363 (+),score=85.39 TRINITY_DN3730_c0_g1_i1:785-1873(+)